MQEVNHLSIRWRSRIIFQRTRKKICHHDRLHSATMRHPIKIMGGWGHTCLKNTPRPRIFRFVTLHLENSRQNETLPLDGNSTIVFSWLPLEILLICLFIDPWNKNSHSTFHFFNTLLLEISCPRPSQFRSVLE